MCTNNVLHCVLRLRGITSESAGLCSFWFALDVCSLGYTLLWFTPTKFGQLRRTEVAYVTGCIFESMFGIYVTCWFRRNWPWLRERIEWNQQKDIRFLSLALLSGAVYSVEPVISYALIIDSLPPWFKPVAVFFEVYYTSIGLTTTFVLLIVVDKVILTLAKRLGNVQNIYARRSHESRPSISGEFFRLLEDANDHLHSVTTGFHIVTLTFSVCIVGCRITILDRETPLVTFLLIAATIMRIGYCVGAYHCGEQVQRRLIGFRRMLLQDSTEPRHTYSNLTLGELLNHVNLRREHSLCLKVFNLPLSLASGLWYLSLCTTMAIVTLQFALVICEPEGISC